MNFKLLRVAPVAACMAAMFLSSASAHHSFAMFDQDKIVTMEGTVTEFEWINPHSWLHFTATSEDGQEQEWSIELASVGQQVRAGWTPETLKPGDPITIEFNPLRDGTRGGTLLNVTLPNGEKLGHGGMPANPITTN
ncbi:MAG: hypothetical protein RJB62_394 [Pseudomonadota bacterium]|jgi:hypothetical protein